MRSRHFVWALAAIFCLAVNFSLPALAQAPGIAPASLPPFGDHDIGTITEPRSAQLTNTSGAKARFKVGKASLPDYQLDDSDCRREIDAGKSCLLAVQFAPKVSGSREATVEIGYDGDSKTPSSTLQLTGRAFPLFLGLSPKRVDFPQQSASATSSPQMVTITNVLPADSSGKSDVTVNRIAAGGDFTVDAPTLPHILKPGGSLSFPVHYAPKQEGDSTGSLLIGTADGSERDIPLAGSTYTLLGGFCFSVLGGLCSLPCQYEFLLILVIACLYWLAMVVVRWHRIANPTRELLRAEIATVRTELDMLPDTLPGMPPPASGWRQKIADLLEGASREVSPKAAGKGRLYRLANFLFWSRGQEIAGWGYVHDAQEKMSAYQPLEIVVARLETAAEQLKNADDGPCKDLANIIEEALKPCQPPAASPSPARLRALLQQALNALDDRDDTDFAKLAGWQNKASWLVGCGLFTIVVLTFTIPHHSVLFVVGAAGGLISRMSRSLNRKDVPTDYGASWTTLFLSPVSGALGAWAGILVSELAVKVNVLGSAFQADFYQPCRATTLALAFVFGFSERLLDDVLDKLDDTATKNPQSSQSASGKPQPKQPAREGAGQPAHLTIQPTLLPGKINAPYDQKLQVSGNVGQVTWSVDETKLPPGLKLTDPAAGAIGGTPTQANTFTFTATVQDGKSTQSQQVTIVINS